MLEKVEQAVRVTQNNDACVAVTLAAARSGYLPNTLTCSNCIIATYCINELMTKLQVMELIYPLQWAIWLSFIT